MKMRSLSPSKLRYMNSSIHKSEYENFLSHKIKFNHDPEHQFYRLKKMSREKFLTTMFAPFKSAIKNAAVTSSPTRGRRWVYTLARTHIHTRWALHAAKMYVYSRGEKSAAEDNSSAAPQPPGEPLPPCGL